VSESSTPLISGRAHGGKEGQSGSRSERASIRTSFPRLPPAARTAPAAVQLSSPEPTQRTLWSDMGSLEGERRFALECGVTLQNLFLLLTAPVALVLWLTVPHCKDEGRRWTWPITFGLSTLWICVFRCGR
jgi:hypothetical protein